MTAIRLDCPNPEDIDRSLEGFEKGVLGIRVEHARAIARTCWPHRFATQLPAHTSLSPPARSPSSWL
ncbi:MAG: hypothetical protein AAFY57_04110 [Cyanobacteria bacterium J06642_2]